MNEYFHAWNCVFMGIPKPFEILNKHCSDLKSAWNNLTEKDLQKFQIHEDYIRNFNYFKKNEYPFREFEQLKNQNIKAVSIRDNNYPAQLRTINNNFSPKIIYIKGNIPSLNRYFMAIVGTRNMSDYGQTITKKLVGILNPDDFVVVSGLARGIDTNAHKAAIDNIIPTIAVLGFGINRLPHYLKNIGNQIIEKGALVSEYPPDLGGKKYHFPLRNRIISGLSKGVVVIEGGENSGALITAGRAGDQGRDVFTIPGRITDENSKGPIKLINDGATPLYKPEHIYDYINVTQRKKPDTLKNYSNEKKLIIEHLKQRNLSKNELMQKIIMPVAVLSSNLTELELENVIEQNRSGRYYLKFQY